MNCTFSAKRKFTLIELLVVIAILAILMSILFPSLKKVLYKSTIATCTTNIKQIATGLMLYTDDYYDQYPHNGAIRNRPLYSIKDRHIWDIGPAMEPYFDGGLDVLNCPVAPAKIKVKTTAGYLMYFKTRASSGGSRIGGLGSKVVQYDINGNKLADASSSSMKRTWYWQPLGGVLNKVGESWRHVTENKYYTLLMSDIAIHYGGHPGRYRSVNHHEFDDRYKENISSTIATWKTPGGSYLYPRTSMNCVGSDLSVKFFEVPEKGDPSYTANFTGGIENSIIPKFYQE